MSFCSSASRGGVKRRGRQETGAPRKGRLRRRKPGGHRGHVPAPLSGERWTHPLRILTRVWLRPCLLPGLLGVEELSWAQALALYPLFPAEILLMRLRAGGQMVTDRSVSHFLASRQACDTAGRPADARQPGRRAVRGRGQQSPWRPPSLGAWCLQLPAAQSRCSKAT